MEILFEDEFIIAINKPAGLMSQGNPQDKRPHVISKLLAQLPGKSFILHHRLDRETSGVMLLSKSPAANQGLSDSFQNHKIQKTYLAIVKKPSHSQATQTSDSPLVDVWSVENSLAPVRGQNRQMQRMVVVKKGGWHAKTDFRLLQDFKDFQLIEAKPATGRTHQIRVHLACQKRPILGDFLYGGKSSLVQRMMLHAQSLELTHPVLGSPLKLMCPPPHDFMTLINSL